MYSTSRNSDKAGRPANGFALLEVMIAIVIFSIGLIALASMQGKLTRYASAAKQRTWAMNLAEDQLENMRAFVSLSSTGAAACSVDPGSFDDLADCTTPVTATLGELTYNMTWTTAAKVISTAGVASPHDPTSPDSAEFKEITVTVSWADEAGDTHSVELKDVIDATSAFNSGTLVAGSEDVNTPSVPINLSDFPDTVPIDLGSGLSKLATNPEPTIENSGNNVVTGFDVISYTNTGLIDRREDFTVVNCNCELNTGTALAKTPAYWDGDEYQPGAEVTKQTGVASTAGNLSGQPVECDTCCKDHHDNASTTVKYDPWSNAAADAFGNHPHYNIVNGSYVLATSASPAYVEACRFIRVDGFKVLTTDMAMESMLVVPEDFPNGNSAAYSTSVVSFVADYVDGINVATYPGTTPTPTRALTVPAIDLYLATEEEQLSSRAIYIDFMQEDLLKKVLCLRTSGSSYPGSCDASDPDWIDILPFFELNVSSLANWSRTVSNIDVSNSPITDVNKHSFSRGLVTVAANPANGASEAAAEIELSNTGLTDTNPIDSNDTATASDSQTVNVNIGVTPPVNGIGIDGLILASKGNINIEPVRLYVDPAGEDCSISTNGSGQKTYLCEMDDAGTGTVASGTVTVSDYNANKVQGNNISVLDRSVCAASTGTFTTTVTDDGIVANPDLLITGETTVFTFTNLSAAVTIDLTIVEQGGACP